jgi:hypothetical protein
MKIESSMCSSSLLDIPRIVGNDVLDLPCFPAFPELAKTFEAPCGGGGALRLQRIWQKVSGTIFFGSGGFSPEDLRESGKDLYMGLAWEKGEL